MAWHIFGAKTLPEPVLTYYESGMVFGKIQTCSSKKVQLKISSAKYMSTIFGVHLVKGTTNLPI